MALKIIKEQQDKIKNIELEKKRREEQYNYEKFMKKKQAEELKLFNKEQERRSLLRQKIEYKEDLKKYVSYLSKYKKRQEEKKEILSKLDKFGKIKYFLKETFIEKIYLFSVFIPLLIFLLFVESYNSFEYLIGYFVFGMVVILHRYGENKKQETQDVGLLKSIGIFTGLLLYIAYIKYTGNFIPHLNMITTVMSFILILPIFGYFNFNSLRSKPGNPDPKNNITNKYSDSPDKLKEISNLISEIEILENRIKKELN